MLITDVSDEPAKSWIITKTLACFILLQLVAREDNNLLGVEVRKGKFDESFAERACATGDEDR
jgi:hypothetical protein